MQHTQFHQFTRLALIAVASGGLLAQRAAAQEASQTLRLQAGWNAVPLHVTPAGDLSTLFAGTPVDLVTTWFPEKQKVASLQDPSAEPWKNPEWRTWQAAGKPGAFLNNLHALSAGQAYLIRCRAAAEVTLSGAAELERITWQPQSFNLTGLPVDKTAPPTLAAFFAGSAAHQPLRAFRLVAGKWQPVPDSAPLDADTAYWIWCGEGSEYQGPLEVRADAPVLKLGSSGESAAASLLSRTGAALPVEVTASGTLPISAEQQGAESGPQTLGGAAVSFTASPDGPQGIRIAWAAGIPQPAAGAVSFLTFRAAGVRRTLPVILPAVSDTLSR